MTDTRETLGLTIRQDSFGEPVGFNQMRAEVEASRNKIRALATELVPFAAIVAFAFSAMSDAARANMSRGWAALAVASAGLLLLGLVILLVKRALAQLDDVLKAHERALRFETMRHIASTMRSDPSNRPSGGIVRAVHKSGQWVEISSNDERVKPLRAPVDDWTGEAVGDVEPALVTWFQRSDVVRVEIPGDTPDGEGSLAFADTEAADDDDDEEDAGIRGFFVDDSLPGFWDQEE